ncbi:hypothetical protein [Mesorhizobium sp. M0296]|uniref:hypothetical protein n=1 Tax=Mesorhizobium sp. M0296 TaxID=2956931 RepID=UPI0033393CC9
MKPNKIAEKARKMIAGKPELEAAMRAEWSTVEAKIKANVSTTKKTWKNYEMQNATRTARLAMLTAFVDGKSPAECAAAALETIGQ